MKKKLKEFLPLWNFIKEDKTKVIICIFLLFISSLATLLTGYLNGAAVEYVTKNELLKAIICLIIYFLISIIIDDGLGIFSRNKLAKIQNKVSRELSYQTYRKILNLPATAFEKKSSGEIINRVTQDADTISFVFGGVIRLAFAFITVFVLYFYIAYNSIIMAIEILFILVLMFFLIKYFNPLLKSAHKKRKEKQDVNATLVNESVRGIREIRTLGVKKSLLKNSRQNANEILDASSKEIDISTNFEISSSLMRSIMEVGVFITGIIQLYYGHINLTFFIAMTYYVYKYTWLIEELESFNTEFQRLTVSLERVNELLENRLYNDVEYGLKDLKQVHGVIEFRNIFFGYPDEETILKGLNLKLEPNKKIAIVGRSGQGKSTLFNLVTRIFDVNEGEILLDDTNIKDLSEKCLNKNISIIRQEPFIFNRTILENFKIINENITLNEIRKYTKMAYLDDYIMSLPNKYDTLLGEGGVNLSGGQKQRLSIARTLAKKGKVILLDEATSALDNKSQNYIKKTIDNLVREHTVIIVAHRLSTIIDADIIYVIEDGQVAASGTHNELLKKSRIYKELYLSEDSDS